MTSSHKLPLTRELTVFLNVCRIPFRSPSFFFVIECFLSHDPWLIYVVHEICSQVGLDKFCQQNFEQNKRFLRRAFCGQNKAFSSRKWAEKGIISGNNDMHNSNCKKKLKLNKKQMENTLWLIWLFNSYNALTLKVRWIKILLCIVNTCIWLVFRE